MIGLSKFCTGSWVWKVTLVSARPWASFLTVITMPREKHRRDPKVLCNYLACPNGYSNLPTNPAWNNLNYLGLSFVVLYKHFLVLLIWWQVHNYCNRDFSALINVLVLIRLVVVRGPAGAPARRRSLLKLPLAYVMYTALVYVYLTTSVVKQFR